MKIKTSELQDLDFPWCDDVVQDTIIDNSRWSIIHEIVFKWTDRKYYKTTYSVGATESQDERPWEYETEVECVEVEQRPVTKLEWVVKE